MAKAQKRSKREVRKPKKVEPKAAPAPASKNAVKLTDNKRD